MNEKTSQQRSLEQERAKAAWEEVKKAKKTSEYQKKYKSLAHSATADIQQNGLGQTLALWRAKSNETHQQALYNAVSNWVKSQIKWQGNSHLLEWIVNQAQSDEYRRATSEAIAFLQWLKRFAEAELEGK
jgi:CRISPR-associated protein Cmr5